MEPIVHGLEEQYGNEIDFVYVNVDDPETRDIQEELGRRGQPHFVLVGGDGEIVTQWFGTVESTAFEEAFQAVLN